MFLASLSSEVMTKEDRAQLFRMLLEKGRNRPELLTPAIGQFQNMYYSVFAEIALEELAKEKDSDVDTLLRQLDDPEIEDDAIIRSLEVLIEKPNMSMATLGLIAPIAHHLRPEANTEFTLNQIGEVLSNSIERLL